MKLLDCLFVFASLGATAQKPKILCVNCDSSLSCINGGESLFYSTTSTSLTHVAYEDKKTIKLPVTQYINGKTKGYTFKAPAFPKDVGDITFGFFFTDDGTTIITIDRCNKPVVKKKRVNYNAMLGAIPGALVKKVGSALMGSANASTPTKSANLKAAVTRKSKSIPTTNTNLRIEKPAMTKCLNCQRYKRPSCLAPGDRVFYVDTLKTKDSSLPKSTGFRNSIYDPTVKSMHLENVSIDDNYTPFTSSILDHSYGWLFIVPKLKEFDEKRSMQITFTFYSNTTYNPLKMSICPPTKAVNSNVAKNKTEYVTTVKSKTQFVQ